VTELQTMPSTQTVAEAMSITGALAGL